MHLQTFGSPGGSTWRDVHTEHAELASAMNLPENRLLVERDDPSPPTPSRCGFLNERSYGMRILLHNAALRRDRSPQRARVTL